MSPRLVVVSYSINDLWAKLTHRVVLEKQMWCGNVWLLARDSWKYKLILIFLEIMFYFWEVPEWRGHHCKKCNIYNCRRT